MSQSSLCPCWERLLACCTRCHSNCLRSPEAQEGLKQLQNGNRLENRHRGKQKEKHKHNGWSGNVQDAFSKHERH